ncbi:MULTISPECIES: HEPN domain-containing protein [Nostocales]|jgi:hypothetical protein|uniref:HEPN domain-containing protein n=1 Tax=Nostocales TaxID=1161 RepID=UPI00029B60E9|nr:MULTISPECIES: HEPN domain-containing protein [Nostocales]AFW96704.1 hypothetical protein ANA_C20253 [Anabaena sp. 90]MBO1051658.1 hypothetical protein [Dolichospermum sp. DET73]MTJ19456.1 hypothetical protein [Dolichospermum sp. UHCC 0299]MTJ40618.1 hypothetical protein [Dolichospermum sp. UHCC 0406]
MSKSARFRTLTRELNRLKKQFLPKINPTGLYSESQLSKTAAYRVLAHAEIESYLEERAWEVVQNAKTLWDESGKTTRTLICLLGFSGLTMDEPPDTLTPKKGSKTVKEEKIKISKKINLALESFKRVISQNHGVKEDHILSLLLPIGIDSDHLDPAWLATMNTFGEKRGLVAHTSATSYMTTQTPDPANELNTVNQITDELLRIDELINNLIE